MVRIRRVVIPEHREATLSVGPLHLSVEDDRGYGGTWGITFRAAIYPMRQAFTFSTKLRVARIREKP